MNMKSNPRTATMTSIVTVLASLSLLGCGNGQRNVTDSGAGQSGAVEPFTAVAQAADASQVPVGSQGRMPESVPADSLPPDVVARTADGAASPGGLVEVAAQASPDVIEVFLWDGIGRKQSFAYDSTANLWRARYRVPLSFRGDRVGLSVTAKNGLDLRSRVWVFVRIERPASEEAQEKQPESESAPTTGQ
jgi:hypothetical protein